MQSQTLWTRNFTLVCISSFFQSVTYFILISTLPVFVKDILHGTSQDTGLVVSAFMVSAILFRPLTGKWVDSFNKKWILFFSLATFLFTGTLYFAAASISLLIAIRFLHGIGFGICTTTTAVIAGLLVPPNCKGEGMFYYSMFMSLATVAGPFLGLSIMANYSFTVLFAFCALCALFAFFSGSFVQLSAEQQKSLHKKSTGFHWRNFIDPSTLPIGFAICLVSFSLSGITTFVSLYAMDLGLFGICPVFLFNIFFIHFIASPFNRQNFRPIWTKYSCVSSIVFLYSWSCSVESYNYSCWLINIGCITWTRKWYSNIGISNPSNYVRPLRNAAGWQLLLFLFVLTQDWE